MFFSPDLSDLSDGSDKSDSREKKLLPGGSKKSRTRFSKIMYIIFLNHAQDFFETPRTAFFFLQNNRQNVRYLK